jgi:sialate O-acetylesterase
MKSGIIRLFLLFFLAAGYAMFAAAQNESSSELKVADVFTDHMVIGKDVDIPIWGTDTQGNKVKVSIGGQTLNATADKDGKWKIVVAPLKEMGPFQLEVESESGKLVVKDILCGEVWIFAGDAVIGQPMEKSVGAKDGARNGNQIRMFNVPRKVSRLPDDESPSKWEICNPDSNDKIPAVPYWFAQEIQGKTNLPVGVIICSAPGAVSEAWMSRDGINAVKDLFFLADYQNLIQNYELRISGTSRGINALSNINAENYDVRNSGAVKRLQRWADTAEGKKLFKSDADLDRWQDKIQDWVDISLRNESNGSPVSEDQKSWPLFIQAASGVIADPRTSPTRPSGLFNGMISPLVPCAVKGIVLWIGEADAGWDRGDSYFNIVTGLIKNWRAIWNKAGRKGDIPFVVVQLQNFNGKKNIQADESFKIRIAQATIPWKLANTATAVTMDLALNEDGFISSDGLKESGQRIAWSALGKFYNQKIVFSGPVFESISSVGGQIKVKFKFDDNGLIAGRDGRAEKVIGFETADSSRKFIKAEAAIDKDSIVINNAGDIVSVRYGWGADSGANLYNKEGLPTTPFGVNLPEKK